MVKQKHSSAKGQILLSLGEQREKIEKRLYIGKGMMKMCKEKDMDGRVEHPGFSYAFIMSLQCAVSMARSFPLHMCKNVTKVVVWNLRELSYC